MPDYELSLRAAAAAWMTVSGLTDAWARSALKRLIEQDATEFEIANDVYRIIKPISPTGRTVEPKLKDGKLSVRNLENATIPVDGASAARTNLETVLFVYENRFVVEEELRSFVSGDPRFRLYGLRSLVKERRE